MAIAKIRIDEPAELDFNIAISGSTADPSDIRFIIEDLNYSIICRVVRDEDSVKVFIPKLLNLMKQGSYRAKMEIVLEDRLFVPFKEEITLEEPVKVEVKSVSKQESIIHEGLPYVKKEEPKVTVTLQEIEAIGKVFEIPKEETEVVEEEPPKKKYQFDRVENPFRKDK